MTLLNSSPGKHSKVWKSEIAQDMKNIRFATTSEFLDKKHVKFDQGLNFLIFYQGNRGNNQEKPMNNQEHIRKNDKILQNPGPYFLFKIFLFNIFDVF